MSANRQMIVAYNRIEVRLTKGGFTTVLDGQDCATILNALVRARQLTVNLESVQAIANYTDAQVEPACAFYADGGGEMDQTVWLEVDCSECPCGTPTKEYLAKIKKEQAARDKKAAKKGGK